MSWLGSATGRPSEGFRMLFDEITSSRDSSWLSNESGTCTAIWSPSKSALNAAHTSGWIRIALPSTSTGSNAWMPRRCSVGAVQEHRVVLDDLFQDLIHLRRLLFDDLFRPLDRLGDPLLHQLVDDEGLEQLDRHRLGEPALVQPQLGSDHDHRTARVVHALAEQVLAEPALLALEHVGQRLERPLAAPADRLGAAAVVEQRVHRLLQHALLVPEDDLRRPVQDQLLQPVVAVDDAAIQVVQIARREAPTVQRHQRPQIGRDDRDDVQDHPAGVVPAFPRVARVPERIDDLQPLELLLLAVLARLARDCLAQLVRQLVDVQSFEQRPHRRRADVGLERRVALGLRLGAQLEEPVFVEQLLVLHLLLPRLDHHVVRVVDHPLEIPQGHVEHVAHGRRQRLEEPDVRHRHRELDVPHALAAHLGERDLHAAAVADDAAVADALVLAAVTLPVLYRAEDPLAEQPIAFRLEGPVVDGLGLRDLAPRPPGALALQLEALALLRVARPADLLRGGGPDRDIVEARALRLAPASEVDHYSSTSSVVPSRPFNPRAWRPFTHTLKDSGMPGFGRFCPFTMASYTRLRPFTSSDLTVKISCSVCAAP